MRKLILLLLLFITGYRGYSQKLPLQLNNDTTAYPYPPLYIINMPGESPYQSFNIYSLLKLDPNQINTINVLKNANAIKAYGLKAKHGVIIINLKTHVDINITDNNSIKKILIHNAVTDNILPVYIDSIYVKHPENVYLDTAKIKSVKIDTEQVSKIRFINILTIEKKLNGKPGEVYIR